MIKNYIKIALRNLSKSKSYTAINMIGLAIAVTCAIYITLFIQDELSYDTFHEHAENIYRVAGKYDQGGGNINESASTTYQLAPQMELQFPSIKRVVRIDPNYQHVVHYDDQVYREQGVIYADSGFFDMFSFEILEGKQEQVLSGSNAAVITKALAKKYFGNENAIGQSLEVNNWPVEVVAVMKPMPDNSHFNGNMVISMSVIEDEYPSWVRNDWSGTSHYTYLQLSENSNPNQLAQQLNDVWDENFTDLAESHEFFLQPLLDIHLNSKLSGEIEANGDLAYLYIFGFVGILVLLMACINYMNLATARSIDRTKEVGVRKVLGASSNQVRYQFFSESIVIAVISVFVGLFFAELLIPYINTLTGKAYSIDWSNGFYWVSGLFLLALLMGTISGIYPAVLASIKNARESLMGSKSNTGGGSTFLRKGLVVVQFAASITILISTAVVFKQLDFMKNKNLGINPSEVVTIPFQTAEVRDQYQAFKDRLLANTNVIEVTATNNLLSGRVSHWRGYELQGREESETLPTMIVAEDFFETLEAQVIAGRTFSKEFATDKDQAYVINEAAVKFLGLENPVGKSLKGRAFTGSEWNNKDATIIGVVKDFHTASLRDEIQPTVFSLSSEKTYPLSFMAVRVKSNDISSSIDFMRKTWGTFAAGFPFEYSFLDQQMQQRYESEQQFLSMFGAFALLAISVACFGVFGLAAFSVNRRKKEFGIRKVLGATGKRIMWLVSRDYALLVLVANIIAWPIAWCFMQGWLQDFAYRINLQLWEFLAMGLLVFVIIILTVGFQAFKAASMNPVKSLRSE